MNDGGRREGEVPLRAEAPPSIETSLLYIELRVVYIDNKGPPQVPEDLIVGSGF
jgi:hypothetical protein